MRKAVSAAFFVDVVVFLLVTAQKTIKKNIWAVLSCSELLLWCQLGVIG